MTSILNFFKKSHKPPRVSARRAVTAELLETIDSDISRAQQFLDRIENLKEITFSDVVLASHNLRLARATLEVMKSGSGD